MEVTSRNTNHHLLRGTPPLNKHGLITMGSTDPAGGWGQGVQRHLEGLARRGRPRRYLRRDPADALVLYRVVRKPGDEPLLGSSNIWWVKIKPQKNTPGFNSGLHLPGFHFGYSFLTHSHIFVSPFVTYG